MMVKVEMPRAQWDAVLVCLRELMDQGWIVTALYNEIIDQVDEQEY
jgi:hypothetical protein